MALGTNLTLGFQVDLKGLSPALVHHVRRPQSGFIPGQQRDIPMGSRSHRERRRSPSAPV